ncbi:MAG: 2-amino-4-hydroxy-6-hydroxymethyldihydropteridine diphosphokinase [Planctomycetota bacterium]|nr:2-amino-4-hydroxy-6-hydroxymethyldihydropteridine diphosphokinase [Planctomycetota bacterium]
MSLKHRAFLGLGSNINPEQNLALAVEQLAAFGTVSRVSSVWESPPMGFLDQPSFLNAAVLLETDLSAEDVKAIAIAGVEQSLKRRRDPQNPNGPRTIDIDILLFNRDVIEQLSIPDPYILTRNFVAVPLAEIAPQELHPVTGESIEIIASVLQRTTPLKRRGDIRWPAGRTDSHGAKSNLQAE